MEGGEEECYKMQYVNCQSWLWQFGLAIYGFHLCSLFYIHFFPFGSSKVDSPRVEYIGFPASSLYCPGFLAEAKAMFFYLLVFF